METFVADPITIKTKGDQILGLVDSFTDNMNKLYATIEQMINSDYLSPEAYVLANEIKKYKVELNNIRNIMANYGMFRQGTSNQVVNNQEDLSQEMRG